MKSSLSHMTSKFVNRNSLILIALLLSVISINAQVPESFNYQAVVRDNSGMIMPDQIVSIQMAVVESSPNGLVKFIENHLTTTNQFGLIKLNVGMGTPVNGEFSEIDWGSDLHFLRISIDTNGGNSFQFLGTTQLTTVPYAMVAKRVEIDQTEDADADPNNEIQNLIIANDTLYISNGNYIVLPQPNVSNNTDEQVLDLTGNVLTISNGNSITLVDNVDDADNDEMNEIQTLSLLGDTLVISNGNSVVIQDNVDDADSSPSNEIQFLTAVGDSIYISNGNYIVLDDDVNDPDNDPLNELQEVFIADNFISLSNSNTMVDLSSFLDNTDSQNILLVGDSLSISGGNKIDMSMFSGGQFEVSGNIVRNGGVHATDDLVFGAPSLIQNGNSAHFAKFFFDKSKKGAFRTGFIENNKWDADSIGNASFAAGYNTLASAEHSTAFGKNAFARGANSVAMGNSVIANGFSSVAFGFGSVAKQYYSFAGGNNSSANGINSFAYGENAIADGTNAFSIGKNVLSGTDGIAIGNNVQAPLAIGISMGRNNTSSKVGSISIGENVHANGTRAVALGYNLVAPSYGEIVMGYNSTSYTAQSAELIHTEDRLFTIGNGVNDLTPSDAFIIYKDGDAFLAGNVVTNSDVRLKKEIHPIQGSLEKVLSLNGYTYKWNGLSPRDQEQLNTGLIAQEVEILFPELVTNGPNGYKAVNYTALIPHLIESIKSQTKQIGLLSQKLSTQKDEIHNMNFQASTVNDLMERVKTLEQQLMLGDKIEHKPAK